METTKRNITLIYPPESLKDFTGNYDITVSLTDSHKATKDNVIQIRVTC